MEIITIIGKVWRGIQDENENIEIIVTGFSNGAYGDWCADTGIC